MWKRKRLGLQTTLHPDPAIEEPELFRTEEKIERDQKMLNVQQQLMANADRISVRQIQPIATLRYGSKFKYKIYECFKVKTL